MRNIRYTLYKKKKSPTRRLYNQIRKGTGFSVPYITKKILGKRPHADIENDSKRLKTMAYIRRSRRGTSKRYKRKRSAYKKKSSKSLVKRVAKLEHGAEVKHKIWSDQGVTGGTALFAGANLSRSTPILVFLNPLTRGDTVQDREGDKATWTRINIKIEAYFGTNITNQCYIKWILFTGKGHHATLPTTATLLQDFYGAANWFPSMMPNINNRDITQKWTILKQGMYKHVAPTDATTESQILNIGYYKPIQTSYTRGNVGDITDIDKNSIFLLLMTDTSVTTFGITLYGESHMFFRG